MYIFTMNIFFNCGINKIYHYILQVFCEALHSNKISKEELRNLMQECSSYHTELVKQAAMGQGFDRHMFALMKMAEENNMPRPEIFDSYEYKFLNKSILSTSTLSSPSVMAGGFGPVVKEGFGIGYVSYICKLALIFTDPFSFTSPSLSQYLVKTTTRQGRPFSNQSIDVGFSIFATSDCGSRLN